MGFAMHKETVLFKLGAHVWPAAADDVCVIAGLSLVKEMNFSMGGGGGRGSMASGLW